MKVKVEFEFDLDHFEEWCQMQFTESDIEKIKNYLKHVDDQIAYDLRDYINCAMRDEK